MKNKILLIFLIFLSICTSSSCSEETIESELEEIKIDEVIEKIEDISTDEIDFKNIFEHSLNGTLEKNVVLNLIGKVLGKELKNSLQVLISILVVIIIHSILKTISENFGNEQTGKIGYFIQIIILITMLVKVYSNILENVRTTLEQLSNLVYTILPLYMSLLATTGNITTSASLEILIILSTNFLTNFINQIVIPIVIVATTLGIISNISDQIRLDKLSKYIKKIIIWILCIFLTMFTCITSLESSLGQGVDNMTSKTGKTVVSTFVPIVGKILGDTVETVLSCTNIVKNSIGTIGVIAITVTAITPIIRISIMTIFLYLISGISETIADEKIVYVLEQIGDTCKVLLASVCCITMMIVIGLTLTMKIGIPV